MKKIFLFPFLLIPVILFAQTGNYQIKGKVGSYNAPAKVFLSRFSDGKIMNDSVVLKNGEFEFRGKFLGEPYIATLILDSKGVGLHRTLEARPSIDMLNFYIENGAITIFSADSISKAVISGSKLNDDWQALNSMLKPWDEKMQVLNNEWMAAVPEKKASEEFKSSLQSRFEEIQEGRKTVLKKFIQSHPNSYASLDVLQTIMGPDVEYSEIEPLFNSLSTDLKKTSLGKALLQNLERGKSITIGATALDFTQNDPNGKPVKLSDFRGKYVLLDFWASWCGPCRQENPNVVRVFNKYKGKNFTVLGVSLDRENGKKAWLKAIETDQLAWTQVSDLKFWNNEVAVLYGVQSIPQNFLIDPEGKIIAKNLRGGDLDKKLAVLLQ